MFSRMVALEGTAKCLVPFTMPDGFNWFLEDIAYYTFLLVFLCTFMPKGSKTTRKHIAARGNVGQCVGTTTTRPGTIPIPKKICPYQALQGCGGASSSKGDATLLALLFATAHQFEFFACGAAEQSLFRVGQSLLEVDEALQVDLADAVRARQIDQACKLVEVLTHRREPERDGWFAGVLLLLHGNESTNVAPDFVEGIDAAHTGIRLACRAVHGEPVFIQTGIDQLLAALRGQRDPIRVKEHVGSPCLEITNHPRQVFVEQRLAQAV